VVTTITVFLLSPKLAAVYVVILVGLITRFVSRATSNNNLN